MATLKTGWIKKLINGVSEKIFAVSHVKSVYYNYAEKKTLADKLDSMDKEIDTAKKSWRVIRNIFSSTSTSDSLSAYQGKVLNDKINDLIVTQTITLPTIPDTDMEFKMPSGLNVNNCVIIGSYLSCDDYHLTYLINAPCALFHPYSAADNILACMVSDENMLGMTTTIYYMKLYS